MQSIKKPQSHEAILISSVPNITYLTGYSNFSVKEREAYLFITDSKKYIITDPRYSEAISKDVRDFELMEISSNFSLEKAFSKLIKNHDIKRIKVEEDNINYQEFKLIEKLVRDIKTIKLNARLIKTKDEIQKIEDACKIGDRAFQFILKKIKKGVSEKEIAFLLESYFVKNNATKSFDPIVAFGQNSSIPHHHTSDFKLNDKSGQFVLLDFGVRYKNYCSDMTRTIFFGAPSNKQRKIYKTVLQAQQKAVKFISTTNNPTGKKTDGVARELIITNGFKSIPHSLGHGIGIEVHESPRLSPKSKDTLKEGMVFSIEPGIYIPDFGGVRIEDLFVIEKGNLRQLTKSPKEIIIL